MFRVLADRDGSRRLEDAEGIPVGWTRGRAIALRGLEDQPQARAVAQPMGRAFRERVAA